MHILEQSGGGTLLAGFWGECTDSFIKNPNKVHIFSGLSKPEQDIETGAESAGLLEAEGVVSRIRKATVIQTKRSWLYANVQPLQIKMGAVHKLA